MARMATEFESVFATLKSILQKQAGTLSVSDDTATCYRLAATPGPATLRAWGGKVKLPMIPVAWVQIGKAYVSYHLMGIEGSSSRERMSKGLQGRMQGKTCFNFKSQDEALFHELESLTASSIAVFRKAGFIV
jgi:hypothetical protein